MGDIRYRLRAIRNLLQHGHTFAIYNILSLFLTTWSKKALYDVVEKDVEILRNTTADMDSVAIEACFPDFN